MKKMVMICFILLLALTLAAPAYCDGPLKKLGRGISNLATCPLELFNRIGKVNERLGLCEAVTYGALEGTCMIVVRAFFGLYEVLTFPVPIPQKYEPILKDPEFFFCGSSKEDA